jgi:hypothetical protein
MAPDLVQQAQRAPQPRDPPTHRRGRHLPRPDHIIRLVGAVLAEQHDESADGRRYLGLEVLGRSRLALVSSDTDEKEEPTDTVGAISA